SALVRSLQIAFLPADELWTPRRDGPAYDRNRSSLRCELPQVIIDVDLQELAPLRDCHRAEHGVWSPTVSGSCMPSGIENFQELLFFDVKVKLCGVRNLEAFRQSQPHRLLWKPINQN